MSPTAEPTRSEFDRLLPGDGSRAAVRGHEAAGWDGWYDVELISDDIVPKGPLNTMADIRHALYECWQWPPLGASRSGMELTVRVSFKRNGEIFGARITYQTRPVSGRGTCDLSPRAVGGAQPLLAAALFGEPRRGNCGTADDIPYSRHTKSTKGLSSWLVPKTR